MAMDHAHGTHAPHDASTPTARPENTRARAHARSRSRDASTDSHHHARDASLGSTGARRIGGGGVEEAVNSNSRGSSPARPHAHSSTPIHSTPPTLLRHAHNLKKCGSSEVSASSSHGGAGRRRSPLALRKSTPGGGGVGGSSGVGGSGSGGGGIGEVNSSSPAGGNTSTVTGAVASGVGVSPAVVIGSGGDRQPARSSGSSVGGGSGSGSGGGGVGVGQSTRVSASTTNNTSNAVTLFDDAALHSSNNEDCDGDVVPSSGVSNGSGELVDALRCVTDGPGGMLEEEEQVPILQRTREAVEHIQTKIQKTKDLIKEEQKARDENVNEYLKLAANADRQQMARIKAVFEKKNQKSAALILQLQKKLENYQKRLREIETHGVNPVYRQPKEMLRDMGQGLKTVISKPKEIAHLIKNKFGSADNIKELAGEEERDEERAHHGSATLPVGASLVPPTSSNTGAALPSHQQSSSMAVGAGGSSSGGHHGSKIGSEEGSECNSSITSESVPGGGPTLAHLASPRNHHGQLSGVDYFGQPGSLSVEQLIMELRESREEIARLREEIDSTKHALAAELSGMREGLAEERFRCERLEEQVNDLTELHQNEMGNLVTNMADMEEKVQYQSEERIRDLHEIVENCHTRIARMEHQQAQQQQQYLTLEGLEDSNARAVFVKLINVLLTVLQVLLLVVATVANILTPLLQTRSRLIGTASSILFVIFVYIQWPELKELWLAALDRYYQLMPFK